MTALEVRMSAMSPTSPVRRKRVRRFYGAMGAMWRYDDRRNPGQDVRFRGPDDMAAVRVSARIYRGI
jgi:hypothetical protein